MGAPRPPPVRYAALFLDAASRAALLAAVPPCYPAVSADHVTLAYRPTDGAAALLPLGETVDVHAAGVADDGDAQAVAVTGVPPHLAPPTPHVTISVRAGIANAAAGKAVAVGTADGTLAPLDLKLRGRVGLELEGDQRRVFSVDEWTAAAPPDDGGHHPLAIAWLAAAVDGATAPHPLPTRTKARTRARVPLPASPPPSTSPVVTGALDWCARVDARAARLIEVWHSAAHAPPSPPSPSSPSPSPSPPATPVLLSAEQAAWALAGVSPSSGTPSPRLEAAARAATAAADLWRARAATLRVEAGAHKALRDRLTTAAAEAEANGDAAAARLLRSRAADAATRAADALSSAAAAAAEGHNGTHINRWYLDLHGLPVADGVDVMARHVRVLRSLAAGPVVLSLIVGWGKNSPGRVARLLPAVTAWLRRSNTPHAEDDVNPGLVHVFLGRA